MSTGDGTEATPRALITGADGQDGYYLTELLLAKGYEVHHLVRSGGTRGPTGVIRHVGDLVDVVSVRAALRASVPHEVYNLAGFSSVGRSWDCAPDVMEVNGVAVVKLLDQIRHLQDELGQEVRFYQASSSEMFGAPEEVPQNEFTALRPTSPYGVSKAAAHLTTINYRQSFDMYACSGILYNHESPRRPPTFVTRKITRGVARIARNMATSITLGNLEISRDWGYAPDYVQAMWLMLQQSVPSDCVVATGVSRSLRDFLNTAFAYVGIEDWEHHVRTDPTLSRPKEVKNLVGDPRRAREELSWTPSKPFASIVCEMVEADLQTVTEA